MNVFHRYDRTIWVRLFGELLTSVTSNMIAPFLVLYLHQKIGGSVLLTMLVIGLQPLTDFVVTLAAGGAADRLGRKPVLIGSLALQSLAMFGLMLADSLWMFALLYVLNGVGRSFYIPAARAQIADATAEAERAEVFALLSTVSYVGVTLGPLLGVLLYRAEPGLAFGLVSAALLVYLLTVWWKVPETAPSETAATVARSASKGSFAEYKTVLTMMICALPISLFYSQAETNFQLHLNAAFSNALNVIAWLATAKGVMVIALQMWIVKRTERIASHKLILFAYVCYALAAVGYGFAPTFALLLVAQLFLTIGESLGLTHLLKTVSLIAPPDKRGRYFSLFGMHWDISRTLGPALGGLVFVTYGGGALFGVLAVVLLLGGMAQYGRLRILREE